MGQLDAVLQSLKVPEKPVRDTSLDAMSAKLDVLSHAIQVIVGALSNRDKNDDFTQASIKKLAGAVQELGREVKARPDFTKSLVRIESDLKNVPRTIPKDVVLPDNSENFKALEKIIHKLPTSFPKQKDADLKPVLEAVFRVLEKVSEPVVIPKSTRKAKWVFKIERDDQDLITRIVVT